MIHNERRLYLIRELLSEQQQYKEIEIPDHKEQQEQLLRSLMNIRSPRPLGTEFLQIQDEYLREEVRRRGITDGESLPVSGQDSRLILWKGDITTLKTDAIVNAANSQMLGCFVPDHRCIDNAIHSAAGLQLREECQQIMSAQGHAEPTGSAKITPGYNLPSKHVIHTVGPIVRWKVTEELKQDLKNCYQSCLDIAVKHNIKTIAFCCISTGEFHFPNEKAAEIAVQTVSEFLAADRSIERVIFNVFKDEDYEIYKRLLG